MNEVLVIGHKNPDTDSICSAIGYADFKRRTGMPQAVAARCGDTNDRIDFVLRTFGVPPPRFVSNVAPKIRDVMAPNVVSVPPGTSVAEAMRIMDERNIRVLPILDEHRNCRGLVSVFKMCQFFFPAGNQPFDSRRIVASVQQLARTLNGDLLFGRDTEQEEDLILMIGAMSLGSLAVRINQYAPEKLVLVVGDRDEIQHLALEERVRVLVITGGLPVGPQILEEARQRGVSLISSPYDSATTAMLCRAAIAVNHMVHEHYLAFHEDELLCNVRPMATESHFHVFPVHDQHRRVVGMLSKSDFLKKVDRKLILVDHNELSQAVQGADQVEILEILDHHRIGVLSTRQPILFRNEPVGSTSTIVAESFFQNEVEMSSSTAGLLLAGRVSDTLNLSSPTTTERDARVLARLEKLSGVDAARFTEKLFASGSILTSRAAEEAILSDCKEYSEGGRTFSVAQIEELGFDIFWKRKSEVWEALERQRKTRNYYFSALLVTDVVQQSSLLLVSGDPAYVERIDYPELEPGVFQMEGVVSRKKQVLPYLTHCLEGVRPRTLSDNGPRAGG